MTSIPEDLKCIVETKDGPICGFIDKSDEGTYCKFQSIPYAKPPLGCLRFLPPKPIKPWKHIIDCTKTTPENIFEIEKKQYGCNEDCLYIEVSTPDIKPKEPMPVMFWIGCFAYAIVKDKICDPSLINDQNIVFVRCSFRLGPFGFLSINDYTAPGNCGLKDLVMALKWVQRNISAFGGDPNNVTLFGHSAGGAIVHLMMLSPMATGLFHKAIIQSVSALNNWSLAKNPSQPVWDLANILGIKNTSEVEVVEELRSISAEDILKAFHQMNLDAKAANTDVIDAIFKPCIELDYEGQPAFITKSPPLIMKSGNFNKVPLIIGSNNIEGAVLQYIVEDFYSDYEKYNENVSLLVPKSLAREDKLAKNIGHQLLKFYLGGEEQLRADTRTPYLQLISDYYFSYYVNRTVRLHTQVAPECPIYYYIINYAGEWLVPKHLDFFNSVGHCAELPFLFKLKTPETCKGSRDSILTRSRVVKMWTNFAKTGNPTPDDDDPLLQITWDPVENKDRLHYLSIGSELTKGRNPFDERMKFWDTLHQEHAFLRALVYFNDLGVSW
ncbi:carboxylesterase 4A-like [Trichoplusia ni]|uniref:Carboxylic ester hydrolase n=1 Tax=Trichoplusia ni TaxID=7111 RepID=A0A7E5WAE0_TRINI|nr:carboxylesterase 4A-like [Trichoplusia ni]XP_026737630.1 carboxylesterase 4A-like [Trichoplusia ni]